MNIQTCIMLENVALMIFCAFLIVSTGSPWWIIVLFAGTSYRKFVSTEKKGEHND